MNAFGFKEPLRLHTWFFWKQSKHLGFMSAMFNQNQLKRHTTTAFKNKVKSVTTASWDMTSFQAYWNLALSASAPLLLNLLKTLKPNKTHNQSNSEVTYHF